MLLPIPVWILVAAAAVPGAEKSRVPECADLTVGSTVRESCFLQADLKNLEAELNATYGKLLDQWSAHDASRERSELVSAQRAWMRYRDETCRFEQSVHGGTLSISFMRCMSRLTTERVDYLNELLY